MELPPLNNTSNGSAIALADTVEYDGLSSEGDESDALTGDLGFGSSGDLEGLAADARPFEPEEASYQRTWKLENENESLKAQLALMKREMIHFAKEEGCEAQMKAKLDSMRNEQLSLVRSRRLQKTKGLGLFNTTTQKRKQHKKRRRWSLSSAEDPEIGIFSAYGQRLEDGSVVLFHDELDAHESGRGLHHRRGSNFEHHKLQPSHPSTPPRRGVKPHKSDAYSSENDADDDNLETVDLLPGREDGSGIHNDNLDDAPENVLFWDDVKDRAGWLVGLMVLQSLSSFIIKRNEELLEEHLVIVQFLTMLVGAGGNAGNQASVRVIRGLAIGAVTDQNAKQFLSKELFMGLLLSCILAVSGCLRAAVFAIPFLETMAITASLWAIVFISIVVGALLPLGMRQVGIDPAHSSTTIQVVMDILGVTITVHVSKLFFSLAAAWISGR